MANRIYSFTVELGQFDLNRTDWQSREREGTEERDEETASSRYFMFSIMSKKIRSISLKKSSEIFLCSVLHGSKERSPSVSRIFLLLVANAIVFHFRWCGDSAMCFVLLVVLLFSITARFGYIV